MTTPFNSGLKLKDENEKLVENIYAQYAIDTLCLSMPKIICRFSRTISVEYPFVPLGTRIRLSNFFANDFA